MAKTITGVVTWLKSWFYDKSDIDTMVGNLQSSKANLNQGQANYNVVTDASGNISVEPKTDISGKEDKSNKVSSWSATVTDGHYPSEKLVKDGLDSKIDTAGTGLSKSGTILNHSNSVTAQSSAVFKKITYDGQGHITGTADVGSSDLPSHNHNATNIFDNSYNEYTHINPQFSNQRMINSAIDTAIGNLQSIKAIEVVSTLPTASASTMGKLYIISENSKINVYYTKESSGSYDWHKMDADILDELSIDWSEIENNPFSSSTPSSFAPSTHGHSIQDIAQLQGALNSRASATDVDEIERVLEEDLAAVAYTGSYTDLDDTPTVPSQNVFYGTCASTFATSTKIVVVNDWTDVIGNVLFVKFIYPNDSNASLKINNSGTTMSITSGVTGSENCHWAAGETCCFIYAGSNTFVMIGKVNASISNYGITKLIDSVTSTSTSASATPNSVKQAYDLAQSKQDAGDCITSIELVDKTGSNDTGTIRLYYGDEPSGS